MTRTLMLERPAFWTEPRDPESWFRALDAVSTAGAAARTGGPRTVWERTLRSAVSRRSAHGLFGATSSPHGARLHGVGLLVETAGAWGATPEARAVRDTWRVSPARGLTELAAFLVRESPWLRALLIHLHSGAWSLKDWSRIRGGRRGLTPEESLIQHARTRPAEWFEGLASTAAGPWLARTGCLRVAVAPDVIARPAGRDAASWAPLFAPVHLLDTVGWLTADGQLSLPAALADDLAARASAARVLADISARRADLCGFVPVEATMRELIAATAHAAPAELDFARWIDELLRASLAAGAIEVLETQPGQARHGRGLFGDPARQLVRWVIHDEFSALFHHARPALDPGRPAASDRRQDGEPR